MNKPIKLILLAGFALTGCTAIDVKPIDSTAELLHVCIQENHKVQVRDFVSVVQAGFERHGISTELVSGALPLHCEYVLTYSARRSWDFTPYLSQADLQLRRSGRQVASAEYHLRGKGGLALNKWAGTKSKIDPVIDKLLGGR